MENRKKIDRIPNSLCAPFIEWCARGGHDIRVKKDKVTIKKGKGAGVIRFSGQIQVDYQMNDYLIDRFYLFCQQWLKHGVKFVDELGGAMIDKCNKANRQIDIAKMEKF